MNSVRKLICGCATLTLFASNCLSAGWEPTLDKNNTITKSKDGRKIERFVHGERKEWGYDNYTFLKSLVFAPDDKRIGAAKQTSAGFFLVAPKTAPTEGKAPLLVIMHGAGGTGYKYMANHFIDKEAINHKVSPSGRPRLRVFRTPTGFYGLYLNCTIGEWWGWARYSGKNPKKGHHDNPTAKRVLDTVKWVSENYPIDRDRIYLTGSSMGGCGTLGVGMPNGDVFAAVCAFTPAGTEYFVRAMGIPDAPISAKPKKKKTKQEALADDAGKGKKTKVSSAIYDHDVGPRLTAWGKEVAQMKFADPPYLVTFSGTNDAWSRTQPALFTVAAAAKFPIVAGWGKTGHKSEPVAMANKKPAYAVALEFPWMEIRKNEAYPVFSDALINDPVPWITPGLQNVDKAGQLNAYFRWKNLQDTAEKFAIDLWIGQPDVDWKPKKYPTTTNATVTFRRLQKFKPVPGTVYKYEFSQNGKILKKGEITVDKYGLLTVPKITITQKKAKLTITL